MYEFVCPAAVQRGGTIVVPVWAITSLISAFWPRIRCFLRIVAARMSVTAMARFAALYLL